MDRPLTLDLQGLHRLFYKLYHINYNIIRIIMSNSANLTKKDASKSSLATAEEVKLLTQLITKPGESKYVVKGEEKKIDYAVKSYLNPTPPLARKIQSRCRDDYHSSILQDAQFGSQYILRINPKENPVLFVGNESKKLSEKDGIDVLGNIVESNYLREGGEYYGDLHNSGHMAIALSHDPDYRYLEQSGVMADQATAMRDPAFYHWHQFLNDLFLKHKNLQPSYNEDQLKLDGVVINSVEITSEGQSEKDTFFTLWQQTDVDISKGLDYTPRGELFIRFTHLNHRAFTFNIQISNSGPTKTGICRIFLAPKYDERGLPFSFKHHKNNFIEMDKFIVKLKQGLNRIERHSTDSSVTIPFEALFQDSDPASQDNVLFSGCGWPEHLLVPKGSVAGTPSLLFIMVSDYTSDQVDDTQNLKHSGHKKSVNFCGLRDNMHPDKRSMGFPFDRLPRDGVSTLAEFLTPNMAVIETTIKFTNQVLPTKT